MSLPVRVSVLLAWMRAFVFVCKESLTRLLKVWPRLEDNVFSPLQVFPRLVRDTLVTRCVPLRR